MKIQEFPQFPSTEVDGNDLLLPDGTFHHSGVVTSLRSDLTGKQTLQVRDNSREGPSGNHDSGESLGDSGSWGVLGHLLLPGWGMTHMGNKPLSQGQQLKKEDNVDPNVSPNSKTESFTSTVVPSYRGFPENLCTSGL